MKENLPPQDATPLRVKELPPPRSVRFGPMITPKQARALDLPTGWSPSMETPPPGSHSRLVTPGCVANLLRERQNARAVRTLGTLDDIGYLSDSNDPPESPALTAWSSRLSGGSKANQDVESRSMAGGMIDLSADSRMLCTPSDETHTSIRGIRSNRRGVRPRTPKTDHTDERMGETVTRRPLDSVNGDHWLTPFLGRTPTAPTSGEHIPKPAKRNTRPKRSLLTPLAETEAALTCGKEVLAPFKAWQDSTRPETEAALTGGKEVFAPFEAWRDSTSPETKAALISARESMAPFEEWHDSTRPASPCPNSVDYTERGDDDPLVPPGFVIPKKRKSAAEPVGSSDSRLEDDAQVVSPKKTRLGQPPSKRKASDNDRLTVEGSGAIQNDTGRKRTADLPAKLNGRDNEPSQPVRRSARVRRAPAHLRENDVSRLNMAQSDPPPTGQTRESSKPLSPSCYNAEASDTPMRRPPRARTASSDTSCVQKSSSPADRCRAPPSKSSQLRHATPHSTDGPSLASPSDPAQLEVPSPPSLRGTLPSGLRSEAPSPSPAGPFSGFPLVVPLPQPTTRESSCSPIGSVTSDSPLASPSKRSSSNAVSWSYDPIRPPVREPPINKALDSLAGKNRRDSGLLDESDGSEDDPFKMDDFNGSQEELLSSRPCSTGRNTAASSPLSKICGPQLVFGAAHDDSEARSVVNDSETEDDTAAEDDRAAVNLAPETHGEREVDDRPEELLNSPSTTDVPAAPAHDGTFEKEAEKAESPHSLVSCSAPEPKLSLVPPSLAAAAEIDSLEIAVPEEVSIELPPPPDRGNNGIPAIPAADELHPPKPVALSSSSGSSSPTESVTAKDVRAPPVLNHEDLLDDALLDDADVLSQPSQTLMDAPPSAPNPVIDNFVDFGDGEDEDDEYGGEIPASFLATIHSMTQDYRRNENSRGGTRSLEDVGGHPKPSQEYYNEDDEITCSFLEGVDKHTGLAPDAQNTLLAGGAPGFVAASGRKLVIAPESLDAIRALAEDDFREAPKVSFVPQNLADLRISSSQRARSRELTSSQAGVKRNRVGSFPGSSIVTGPSASEVSPLVSGDTQSLAAVTRAEDEDAQELEFPQASPPLSETMKKIAVSIVESPHVNAHAKAAEPYTEDPSPKRARYKRADVEFHRLGHLLPETPHPQQEPPSLADSAVPFFRFADRVNGATPNTPAQARPPDTNCMLETPSNRGSSTFPAFSTGSGKRLPKISEKAQLHAKQLGFEKHAFERDAEMPTGAPVTPQCPSTPLPANPSEPPDILDILFNPDPLTPNVKSAPSFAGFSTGAGKALPPTSAKARAHARVLGFDDDVLEGVAAETPVPNSAASTADPSTRPQAFTAFDTPTSKSAVPSFFGFASGSGKRLAPVSERARAHVRGLGFVDPVPEPQQSPISRQSLSSSLIGETPTRRPSNAFQTPVSKPPAPAAFGGFASGNGKQLPPISQQARAQAQTLGFDDEALSSQPRRPSNAYETPVSKPPSEFKGFASGNGKQLPPVSDTARAHLKLLGLDDDEAAPSESRRPFNAFETPVSKPPSGFQGFASGNGKQLPPVSEKARAHLKLLGLDDDEAALSESWPPSNACETPVSKPPSGFQGFASGNGKQLPPVSEKARAHLKLLGLDDDEAVLSESRSSNGFETPVSKPPLVFEGFASGNGKQLPPVSEKARAHLKLLGLDHDAPCAQTPAGDPLSEGRSAAPAKEVRSEVANTAPNSSSPSATETENGPVAKDDEPANKENEAAANGSEPPNGSNAQAFTSIPPSVRRVPETPIARKSVAVPKRTPFSKKVATVGPYGKVFALPGSPTTMSPSPQAAQTPAGRSSSFSSPMSAQKKMFKPLNICVKLDALQDAGRGGPPPSDHVREITQPKKTHVPLCDLSARPQRPMVISNNRHMHSPDKLHEVNQDVLGITAENAGSYAFRQSDGTTWGALEARTQLLQKDVSANLVTEQWVKNHFRWIVWQLAGQVRSFPELEPKIWHKDAAFNKLVYRYEREINCASRSAIKKIVERDDIPESYMVLSVSHISKELLSNENWDLELTDGWYPIKASIDEALQLYIRQRKILVGDKISVCGAQLVGPADPCPVLEATDAVRLKLAVNGTHRARWNARLGYQRSRHFIVGLRQVLPAGGAVPCVDVVVCRRYVPRFLEKLPEGGSVFRNQKAEEEACRVWQREHSKALQRAISVVEAEFANVDESPDGTAEAADWEEEIKATTDPAERVRLKACQKEAVENAQRYAMERRQALMMDEVNARMETEMPSRDVSKFITFRVCDYPPEGILVHQTREALLTVWNPDEGLASRLQEGRRFKIYNLTTSDNARDNRISLNVKAQRSTKYIERPAAADRLVNSLYSERVYARVDTLVETPSAADVDVLVVTLKTSEIREVPQQNTAPRYIVTVLCTDQSKALLVLEVSAGTREAVDFQPFTPLHCHNLEYVYYDRHFNVLKLKETPNSDVARIARTPYEKAQDRLLSVWCKESFAELREMVTSNNGLLQDMATYTGAEKADARARESTQSDLAVEEQNHIARDGEVYDDEIFGNLSLSLPCDEF
ncbi:Breast cancer 2, early onset [Geranomyces variabilis]|nr:Breast cancer 2, early onset [Geranomyces variabilis]